jgi:hypothetical protein
MEGRTSPTVPATSVRRVAYLTWEGTIMESVVRPTAGITCCSEARTLNFSPWYYVILSPASKSRELRVAIGVDAFVRECSCCNPKPRTKGLA